MKTFLKVVGIILLVLVLIAGALGITGVVLINKASSETATVEYDVEETNLVTAMLGTIVGQDIVLTEGNVNSLIKTYAGGIANEKFSVKELFVKLDGDKGTVYADLSLSTGVSLVDKVYHISADFTIDYEGSYVTVNVGNITCGELTLGAKVLALVEKYVELPSIVSINADQVVVTYDCSQLDAIVEGVIAAKLEDPSFIESMGDYGKLISAVPADQLPDVVDVNIENIALEDSSITITASFIDVNALLKAAGSAALEFLFGGN